MSEEERDPVAECYLAFRPEVFQQAAESFRKFAESLNAAADLVAEAGQRSRDDVRQKRKLLRRKDHPHRAKR